MAATHKNRVRMTVTGTPGTGTITLNAASSGYQTFAAAYAADATVDILITDGTAWEVARNCAYTNSGTTVTRGTLEASSTGSAISLTSSAIVSVIATATRGQSWDDLASVFGFDVVSVTGATTATIGKMHHCTGTTADYTVTLPAASGNSGKMLGFRMGSASGLTKLVTLDGNASETIDGATTRIMWAEETAILLCDGSNWFKVAGKSVPLQLMLQRSIVTGDQAFSSSTWTACETPETIFGISLMYDSTNKRIKIVRPGKYLCVASFYCVGTSITVAYGNVGLNQAANTQVLANIYVHNLTSAGTVSTVYSCAVNDYIVASAYLNATSPRFESDAPTTVAAIELPQW